MPLPHTLRGSRIVKELRIAFLVSQGPAIAMGKRRMTAAQRKGIYYEKRVSRHLKRWAHEKGVELLVGQWIRFEDVNGRGFAQPDAFTVLPTLVVVFEAKLTQADGAEAQCEQLYRPLLEYIYKRPVVTCQVFRNIRYSSSREVAHPNDLIGRTGHWCWHHLGED